MRTIESVLGSHGSCEYVGTIDRPNRTGNGRDNETRIDADFEGQAGAHAGFAALAALAALAHVSASVIWCVRVGETMYRWRTRERVP